MNFQELHRKAIEIVGRYKRAEAELIDILQKIDHTKSYREFHHTSLFSYAVKELGLTEDVAYNFINVARKAAEVPALKAAIANSEITVSKAKKITSVLNQENQSQWLSMAKSLPQKMLEKEVARINPKAATQDKASYVTDKRMQLTMGLSEELMEQFKRVQDLECQNKQKAVDYEATLTALVKFYLDHKDPMRKTQQKLVARLVKEKEAHKTSRKTPFQTSPKLPSEALPETSSKIPKTLTPARKQFVLRHNDAQCTQTTTDGSRCQEKRWLHIHHLKERAQGGTHSVENLTVLCAAHHQLLHRSAVNRGHG